MIQKSLKILFATALLAMASIVGYALLRFRGVPDALAEAEARIAAKDHAGAIGVLEHAAGSPTVARNRELRHRLWRLRLGANSALDNLRGALNDVENLLEDGLADDEDLRLERIRLLSATEQGNRALKLANEFLEARPDHARALELAGDAARAATTEPIERIAESIRRDVGVRQGDRAVASLQVFLHRPDGDDETALALAELRAIYAADPRIEAAWPALERDLRDLRPRVQQGLRFWSESLARAATPTTAASGFVRALTLARRDDDALLQAEILRRRVENEDEVAAGATAAWALLKREANTAATAMVERWLPSPTLQPRVDAKTLGKSFEDLLLARVLAAWRIDDRANLTRFYADFVTLQRANVEVLVPRHLLVGLLHGHSQEWKHAEGNFRYVTDLLVRDMKRPWVPDVLSQLVPYRIDVLRRTDAPEATILALYNTWIRVVPDDPGPRIAFIRYLMEHGQVPAARDLLGEAFEARPDSDDLFLLRVLTEEAAGQRSGQTGMDLLAQCAKQQVLAPEVPNPIGYVLCAQAALAQARFDVVRECSRLAIEAFPRARLPRLLEIQACLLDGRAAEAVELAERLRKALPPEGGAALLSLSARRAAHLPLEPALMEVIAMCPPTAELQADLLRSAVEHTPRDATAFVPRILATPAASRAARLLAARALAIGGRPDEARSILESTIGDLASDGTTRDEQGLALAAWARAASRGTADAVLAPAMERLLAAAQVGGTAGPNGLCTAAAAIAPTHPRTAYALVTGALTAADPEARSGKAHALAGDLAARLGLLRRAEEHWLAAIAFPEGATATADLARACLAEGRTDRALAAHRLVAAPRDAALAAWAGDTASARSLATATLGKDALDLLANATLAVLGDDTKCDWQAVPASEREQRLELLAVLGSRVFGAAALERAKALAAREPGSVTTRLLLARAHLLAGDADAAAKIHEDLRRSAPPLLWSELAFATGVPGYVLSAPCGDDLVGAMGSGACAGSSTATIAALRRVVDRLAAAGNDAEAQGARELVWQTYPSDGFRLVDLPHLARVEPPSRAWPVFVAALGDADLDPDTRTTVCNAAMACAERIASAPGAIDDVYAFAVALAAARGPYGAIVHFVLAHGERCPGLRPDPATARSLLLGQIALAAGGDDPGPWLERSVERLLADTGPAATLDDLEGLLRRFPTSLALWQAHTTTMSHARQGRTGVARLRNVLAHVDAPEHDLALVVMAGLENALEPTDQKRLDALPKGLLGSPTAQFARGLALLRNGRPDDALGLLGRSDVRADGAHLFLRALAHLQSRDAKGAVAARGLLDELAANYAKSSWARYAGNFASQLAPR